MPRPLWAPVGTRAGPLPTSPWARALGVQPGHLGAQSWTVALLHGASAGSGGGPGEGRTAQQDVCCRRPRSRSARCCRASAVLQKGRAALRGSSIPLLNPSCNFKSTANKAQLP